MENKVCKHGNDISKDRVWLFGLPYCCQDIVPQEDKIKTPMSIEKENNKPNNKVEEMMDMLRKRVLHFDITEHDTGEEPLHEVIYHVHEDAISEALTSLISEAEKAERERIISEVRDFDRENARFGRDAERSKDTHLLPSDLLEKKLQALSKE